MSFLNLPLAVTTDSEMIILTKFMKLGTLTYLYAAFHHVIEILVASLAVCQLASIA